MVGEEKGWLQRFIIWRERNIKEKRFLGWHLYGICCIDIESVDTLDTEFSYGEL